MTSDNWKDNLAALLADPNLPQGEPQAEKPEQPTESPKPRLTVAIDRKRAGKVATIISGFDADDPRCGELEKVLKRRLAVGGSSRGGEILIQGDRVKALKEILPQLGYKTNK